MPTWLDLDILPQPDDVTCGPTCLHAVYRFFGEELPIQQVIDEVVPLETRGTLAVLLGHHALQRGYAAHLWVYDLEIFDPTWFMPGVDLAAKLRDQMLVKTDPRLHFVSRQYLRFLEMGGTIHYEELNPALLRRLLRAGRPILAGLSATYLYGCARERDDGTHVLYDDVRGSSAGHFVVMYGYHPAIREVQVADPLRGNPRFGDQHYSVGIHRLVGAIMLGVLTFDGNLLVLDRPGGQGS
ncbi:MAG: hypothetical protein KY453_01480 [Gemmatimonadetes bacterium]|nr:hypothetical protein [Gemmatimonadota bacterium]